MKHTHWLLLFVSLALLGVLSACAAPAPAPVSGSPKTVGEPQEVVAAFYDWYTSFEGSPLGGRGYRDSAYLSAEFIQEIDALVDSFARQQGGGFDPFICAQDAPQSITVVAAEGTPELTRVTVQAWNPIYVDLKLIDWEWKIVAVHCIHPDEATVVPPPVAAPVLVEPMPEAPAPTDPDVAAPVDDLPEADASVVTFPVTDIPADWVIFQDEQYGFRLWHPADWDIQKLAPAAGMELPDGEKARKYTLLLQPQAWAGVAAPLHIDVTEGTADLFALLYPDPTMQAEAAVGDYPAAWTLEVFGEMSIASLVVPNPAMPEVRIVFRDMLGGFPERLAGNEAVSMLSQQIIGTVTFQ